jgi:photosynthetic reaction center cytochrome c subunit
MATMAVLLMAFAAVAGPGQNDRQAVQVQNAELSDAVFKNVRVLKGIPVDEFMDTMGMFASSLGYDCSSCHSPDIRTNREAFAIDTPALQRARGMIAMVNAINRTYFSGEPRVSCFTCHRGNYSPEIIPNLALQYGELKEDPNAFNIFPDRRTSAGEVFEKYFQALGGKEQLAKLTSFAATGTYSGFNTGGADVPLEIFASAPDRRTQILHMDIGDGIKTYDGRNGWVAEEWRPMPLVTLTGGNLAGARLDAIVSFPPAIQTAFSEWQTGSTVIEDRAVEILQGRNPGETPVNLYFDESGLLVRMVRWNKTAVGIVPTQIDYADYREVAGVKVPFRTTVTWTDGQNTFSLKDVRPNVPVDPANFNRPAPFKRR